MQKDNSIDELGNLSARADELLLRLEESAGVQSNQPPTSRSIIHTPEHVVELAINKSQRMKCQLQSIEFTESEILLSALLYPERAHASPVPFVIDTSTIKGWTGDGSSIELVLPDEHYSVKISQRQAYGTSGKNKIVDIVDALRDRNIAYISERNMQRLERTAKPRNLDPEEQKEVSPVNLDQVNTGPKPDSIRFFKSVRQGKPEAFWRKIYNNADTGMARYEFGILVGICYALGRIFAGGEGYGYMFFAFMFSLASYRACRRLYRKKATFNLSLVIALMSFSMTPVGFAISRQSPQNSQGIYAAVTAIFGICAFITYIWSSSRKTVPRLLMSILTANMATMFSMLGFVSIDIMPSNLYRKGLAYASVNRIEDAKKSFNGAIEAKPENPAYLLARGNLLLRAGDYNKAASDLEKANQIGFDDNKKDLAAMRQEVIATFLAKRYSRMCELSRRLSSYNYLGSAVEPLDREIKDYVNSNC